MGARRAGGGDSAERILAEGLPGGGRGAGQTEQESGLQIQAGLKAVAELGDREGSCHEERASENPQSKPASASSQEGGVCAAQNGRFQVEVCSQIGMETMELL